MKFYEYKIVLRQIGAVHIIRPAKSAKNLASIFTCPQNVRNIPCSCRQPAPQIENIPRWRKIF